MLPESQMLSESTQAVLCDPLVINTGSNLSADVKSSKISFDLNSDGVEENMSALGENSAFLSLDKMPMERLTMAASFWH